MVCIYWYNQVHMLLWLRVDFETINNLIKASGINLICSLNQPLHIQYSAPSHCIASHTTINYWSHKIK